MEDLIPRENVVITMTKLGYIKRMSMDTFKSENRGGKGIKGMQTRRMITSENCLLQPVTITLCSLQTQAVSTD